MPGNNLPYLNFGIAGPVPPSNPAIWLRSDDFIAHTGGQNRPLWPDKSGNAANIDCNNNPTTPAAVDPIQLANQLNEKPAVVYSDTSAGYFGTSITNNIKRYDYTQPSTIIWVAKFNPVTTGNYIIPLRFSENQLTEDGMFISLLNGVGGYPELAIGDSQGGGSSVNVPQMGVSNFITLSQSNHYLIMAYNGSGFATTGNWQIIYNGSNLTPFQWTNSAGFTNINEIGNAGVNGSDGTSPAGNWYEFLYYTRLLSSTELTQLKAYFKYRYNLG